VGIGGSGARRLFALAAVVLAAPIAPLQTAAATTPPHLVADVGRVDFGFQRVGTYNPAEHDVTFTNTGGSSLHFSDLFSVGADFFGNSDCHRAIPPNGTCLVRAFFGPTARGARSTRLVAKTDGGTVRIPFVGSGTLGYYMLRANGVSSNFGDAFSMPIAGEAATFPAVGLATTRNGDGFWQVDTRGAVSAEGNATYHGDLGKIALTRPIVGLARTPSGNGYWLVASDGGVFAFGDAKFHGSTGAMHLAQPIVGMAGTASGRGYWLVASDGGIFAFGDAKFYGSTGAMHLNQPIVGMGMTASGRGYSLVASDGGIFSFGDARFYGSTGALQLTSPIVGMQAAPDRRGYWLVARDGGVFTFGPGVIYEGSLGGRGLDDIVAMAETSPPLTWLFANATASASTAGSVGSNSYGSRARRVDGPAGTRTTRGQPLPRSQS
jgi:hypothetical protein